jgi:hypothetical protein
VQAYTPAIDTVHPHTINLIAISLVSNPSSQDFRINTHCS